MLSIHEPVQKHSYVCHSNTFCVWSVSCAVLTKTRPAHSLCLFFFRPVLNSAFTRLFRLNPRHH